MTVTMMRVDQEILYQSDLSRVVRRPSADNRSTVICKEFLGPNALQRMAHERRIMERLCQVPGVPRLAEGTFSSCTLAMEDVAALPLESLLVDGRLKIERLLEVALQLTRTLAAVHKAGVSYRNLTLDNLLSYGANDNTLLVDFSLATTFAEERPGFVHHRDISGTLAYLAPEQTGRTGRPVDYRADLYALGATLYRLATGSLPFAEGDPLQLIHDILVKSPVSPSRLDPAIPEGLSRIVMRLLEKEPDRRYQSAEGVGHDLRRLHLALATGAVSEFPLGERDFPLKLTPPSRLVGRDSELALVQKSFEGALLGKGGSLFIGGAPGVGKTALINELRPLVSAHRGWFVMGKFDQYRRDLSTDAVYQNLCALGRLLLAEPAAELAQLREKLLRVQGHNAGITAGLIPEFALLLGTRPETLTGDPLQNKDRLAQSAVEIVRVIASHRPLVLVLDDLQWAAPTPLAFLDMLVTESAPGLFLVGAFREGEVDAAHPLRPMLSRWSLAPSPPQLLRLPNLSPADLSLLLEQMLRLSPSRAADLAEAVAERSDGNPYDTVELINALRREGILVSVDDGWEWHASSIRRFVGGGDVVDLLTSRLEQLPPDSRILVQAAACLGGEVHFHLLQEATGLSRSDIEERLEPAFEDGLLVLEENEKRAIRFRHDRVQQAAYDRLDPAARRTLHLGLARRLSASSEYAPLAAEQYLPVIDAVEDAAEALRVVHLLREAAGKAENLHFAMTERFLSAALQMAAAAKTMADACLLVDLKIELHAALYSLARLEEGDRIYQSLERVCEDPVRLSRAASLQICSLTNRGCPGAAVTLGLALLFRLGVAAPKEAELQKEIKRGLNFLESWVMKAEVAYDVARAEAAAPLVLAAARLINRMIPPAYFSGQAVTPWLFLVGHRLWVEHGPCAPLVGPLSHASFITIGERSDYRTGYRAVRHVLSVAEARGYEPDASQARLLFSLSSGIWFEPLEDNLASARISNEGLLHGGDLQNACFSYFSSLPFSFECSETLETYLAETEGSLAFTERTGNLLCTVAYGYYRDLALVLTGGGDLALTDTVPPQGMNGTLAAIFHSTRALAAAFFGDVPRLTKHAAEVIKLLPFMVGCYGTSLSHFLKAQSLTEMVKCTPVEERAPLLSELDACRDWLVERAADAPSNYRHLLLLVDAERAGALGDFRGALQAFDLAMAEVAALQRPWHRALITERAALFHLENGLERTGIHLLREARRHYEAWGAAAKVLQLEESYPVLRAQSGVHPGERTRPSVSLDTVDMLAVLRASQALSSETSLERLRAQVVELLGTMTGASRVSLVLWQEEGGGEWYLLAHQVAQERCEPLKIGDAGERNLLPLTVFRYVERTREALVVEDAVRDERFRFDLYFSSFERCSILALPILSHGTLRAVLLLENDRSRGAFTGERLDAVQLMAGQLAVSLENALLYRDLEERVRQRTAELTAAQSELVATARQAGMAEIATNVLHNVGNVLNSVNISAGVVVHTISGSKTRGLARTVQLMKEHAGDLGGFLTVDERGRLLPGYLEKLSQALEEEQQGIMAELSRLTASVDHIKEIVATQQSYAGASTMREPTAISSLLEDALRMNAGALERHQVSVVREFAEVPPVPLDRARVLQILVNLISNGKYAMDSAGFGSRLTLSTELKEGRLRIRVRDEGEGIAPENLLRIFSHGFTTRRGGHGFGLHSSSLAAKEMGGTLTAHSDGVGKGAEFTLELPV